jgi:hypothetical protein
MIDQMQYAEKDPRHHTLTLKQMLNDMAAHTRGMRPKSPIQSGQKLNRPAHLHIRG